MKKLIVNAFLSALFVVQSFSQQSLSYVNLVKRLYDMEHAAKQPAFGEISGNFLSFDRRSKYDSATNTYVAWGANDDGSGYIRKEGNDMVVFEKDGPGVILRFWSALAKVGHIKIFIDNKKFR